MAHYRRETRCSSQNQESYMSLRAIRNSVILAGLAVVGACGPAPGAPSPPDPMVFRTTVRIVSALDRQLGLPQVVLTVANGLEQQTDGLACR
jgi:hypothetical protein